MKLTVLMRQMKATLDLAEMLREKGRRARSQGKPETSCRYRLPWCREQWMRGWQERDQATSVECTAKSKRGRW